MVRTVAVRYGAESGPLKEFVPELRDQVRWQHSFIYSSGLIFADWFAVNNL